MMTTKLIFILIKKEEAIYIQNRTFKTKNLVSTMLSIHKNKILKIVLINYQVVETNDDYE